MLHPEAQQKWTSPCSPVCHAAESCEEQGGACGPTELLTTRLPSRYLMQVDSCENMYSLLS